MSFKDDLDSFESIGPLNSPEASAMLAMRILGMKERSFAVSLCQGLRETIISVATAMSLVSYGQNTEDPIIAFSPEELEAGETAPRNPGEMLESLAVGFNAEDFNWDGVVEIFLEAVRENEFRKVTKSLPKEFTVKDILGG